MYLKRRPINKIQVFVAHCHLDQERGDKIFSMNSMINLRYYVLMITLLLLSCCGGSTQQLSRECLGVLGGAKQLTSALIGEYKKNTNYMSLHDNFSSSNYAAEMESIAAQLAPCAMVDDVEASRVVISIQVDFYAIRKLFERDVPPNIWVMASYEDLFLGHINDIEASIAKLKYYGILF